MMIRLVNLNFGVLAAFVLLVVVPAGAQSAPAANASASVKTGTVSKGAETTPVGTPVTTAASDTTSRASTAPQTTATTGTSASSSGTSMGNAKPAATGAAPSAEPAALPNVKWSFDGPFGTYDRGALQRGFQIYSQVCSACHSMNRLSYRNLTGIGYNADEVKAIAASHDVEDGPNDDGEMFKRPGLPSDHFVAPFANKKAAAAANNGAAPPDMSLLAKAREDGPTYIYAILHGYETPPAGSGVPKGRYWNKYMPGHVIAMPPPIQAGQVTYEDGSPQTLDQYASDIATFLAWSSEPHLEDRHRIGVKAMIFLMVFAGIMYLTKKKIWKDMH